MKNKFELIEYNGVSYPEKYVSKITVENEGGRTESFEQYVNVVYTTQGEKNIVKIYKLEITNRGQILCKKKSKKLHLI